MKRCIVILLALLGFSYSYSQRVRVTSFVESNKDLSARTAPRKTVSGEDCALVKVQSLHEGVSFDGDIVGEVNYKMNEYWVYVNPSSDFLVIQNGTNEPTILYFEDYDNIHKLNARTTYLVILENNNNEFNETYRESFSGTENGFNYVDLGLSVCWAICNVGADAPEQLGFKVAWGECRGKKTYTPENYKFGFLRTDRTFSTSKYKQVDETLKMEDDVAHSVMQGGWRMPTADEMRELRDMCTFYYTSYKNVEGWIITGPNGKSIFLPKTESTEILNGVFEKAHYWTSVSGDGRFEKFESPSYAQVLRFVNDEIQVSYTSRFEGCYVRPVIKKH